MRNLRRPFLPFLPFLTLPHAVRRLIIAGCTLALLVFSGCEGAAEDFCGMSGEIPSVDEVEPGRGTGMRDGEAFSEEGSWGPGPSSSVDVGVLSMIIVNDESGSETEELITRGAFPICVQLGQRSKDTGSANYVLGGFITDDSVGGSLTILGIEGSNLLGRFALDLQNGAGETLSITDGVFNLPER
ncbi:MAG: hypothetical protein GY822_31085 [Deltaproteobacteria bacterium]|nr:hypothetical protein [Deltaproteobacteria bacterium]